MARVQATAASAAAEKSIPTESSENRQAKSMEAPGDNTMPVETSASQGTQPANAGDAVADSASLPEKIQLIAYQLWIDRGCPVGSPEIDWMEAERICRNSQDSAMNDRRP